jgi:hypothetical protein
MGALAVLGLNPNLTPVMNIKLSKNKAQKSVGQCRWCLLEFVKPTFPRLGSLVEVDRSFRNAGRSLTQNISNII